MVETRERTCVGVQDVLRKTKLQSARIMDIDVRSWQVADVEVAKAMSEVIWLRKSVEANKCHRSHDELSTNLRGGGMGLGTE